MNPRSLNLVAAAGIAVTAVCGCASDGGPSALTATVQRFPGAEPAVILNLAALSMAEQGFEIDRRNSGAEEVVSYPMELSDDSLSTEVGSAMWADDRRCRATTQVRRTGDATTAYCRVEIQERATDAGRFHAAEHGITDVPSDTPIDRDGATTREQNTMWRSVGRDKRRERAILEMIAGLLKSDAALDDGW